MFQAGEEGVEGERGRRNSLWVQNVIFHHIIGLVTYTHRCNGAFCVLNLPEGIRAHKEEGGESTGLLAEEALGIWSLWGFEEA